MPALHQEPDDMVVVGKIREVLEQRIGSDRFGLWFADRVEFRIDHLMLILQVDGEFALERLRGKYLRAVESAAAEVLQRMIPVRLQLAGPQEVAAEESTAVAVGTDPVADTDASAASAEAIGAVVVTGKKPVPAAKTLAKRQVATETASISRSATGAAVGKSAATRGSGAARGPSALSDLLLSAAVGPRSGGSTSSNPRPAKQRQATRASQVVPSRPAQSPALVVKARKSIRVTSAAAAPGAANRSATSRPESDAAGDAVPATAPRGEPMTLSNFVTAASNTLATTAARLLTADPSNAAPLCLWGATGTGKTHLLSAIRHELRTRHRLPRVILLSAEEFTNDFLSCVRGTGLPAFRKRYRDVDALLIDNVQFLGGKSATLREMLYTVDAVLSRRRPLVLASDRQPLEIDGLSGELAGRMSSGLVCGINPMELQLRRELFRRHAGRSYLPWDEETIEALAERTVGDGRVIQGVAQLVSMLQRMYRRMPTLQEITTHAGEMLQRGPKSVALADVERAVCTAFGLSSDELKSESKSRSVSQPRILAMYLSRQHTTAAFAEIGRYYGDRNHSTVIAAHRRVETWLKNNQPVGGRGPKNMKAQDAIAAVENLLRIG